MRICNDRRYLSNQNLSGVSITGKSMRATRAHGSSWHKCSFEKVTFDSSTFTNATFIECQFSGCSFQNSSFTSARVIDCQFYRCDLIQCDMASISIENTVFILSKLEYSSFLEAFLNSVAFNECDLTGAHLLYATSKDVDYTGSNLHNCSVKLGCPFFRGSTFDGRQWSYMQSLIHETKGNEDKMATVFPLIEKNIYNVTHRMMTDPDQEEAF